MNARLLRGQWAAIARAMARAVKTGSLLPSGAVRTAAAAVSAASSPPPIVSATIHDSVAHGPGPASNNSFESPGKLGVFEGERLTEAVGCQGRCAL
jgi:hypothetical protein